MDAAGAKGHIGVLVGDFRLGNNILLEDPVPPRVMVDGFLGITSAAMTTELDRVMLERGLAGMRAWHAKFGPRARYVLWAAFGRQVQDRLAGRHIVDGRYRHPVFNYDEIAAALPDLDIVDLAPLLRLQQHEVSRLFIDGSNHPSQIGYLLLNGMIFERLGAQEAYDRAVATVEAELLALARKVSESAGRPVLLTGRSVWLDTVSRYMGAHGAQRLAEAGIILAPLDHVPGQPPLARIVERTDLAECAAVVVSAGGRDLSPQLARAFRTELSAWTDVPVIDWESSTEKAIGDRRETPRFARLNSALPVVPDAVQAVLVPPAVEQGQLGTPSWSGITALLRQIAKSHRHAPISAGGLPKADEVQGAERGAAEAAAERARKAERATHIDQTAACAGEVEHPVRLQARAELHGGSSLGRFGFLNVGTVVYGGVEIGRYFSCGRGTEIGVAPHPLTGLSTHGFTVDSAWFSGIEGYGQAADSAPEIPAKETTRIGHDVWIGAQAVVMPGVTIHTGAVIAANAVVTRDVEPYEIVGGTPAKHIKFRFTEDIRRRLLASEWWNLEHDVIQQLPYRNAVQAVEALEALAGPKSQKETAGV